MSHLKTINLVNEVLTEYKDLSLWELGEVIYELTSDCYIRKPVDIITFIKDNEYLGNTVGDLIFPFWLKFLKDVYPHPCLTMYNEIILSIATGTGKCHGKGTKILMYDGSTKNVEDIKVGDLIMGDDSTPRTVKSLCRGRENMYRIIPKKGGEPFTCNESHILSLQSNFNKGRKYIKDKITNISIRDYLKQCNQFKHINKLYRKPVTFLENNNLVIDPYIFGLWLGGGDRNCFQLTTADNEVAEVWTNYGINNGFKVRIFNKENTEAKSYLISVGRGKGNNKFNTYVRNSLVNGEKRIPKEYLINSRENRLKLLAGIVDSDGYVYNKGANLSIVTKLKGLADDYAYLCRSLGFKVSVNKYNKKIKRLNFEGEYFSLEVSGKLSEIPNILQRRKMKDTSNFKNPLRSGFDIEPLGEGDYYGFELDGNHLYLLGDFTVTHNSSIATISLAYEAYKLLCLKNPFDYYMLTNTDKFALSLFGPSHAQASSVAFTKLLGYFSNSPFFRDIKAVPKGRTSVTEEGVSIGDFITIHTGSSLQQALGKLVFSSVMDEVSYTMSKDPTEKARELHIGIRDRRKSRFPSFGEAVPGIIWLISSPKDERDYLNEAIEKIQTNPWGAYFDNIPRWEVHEGRANYLGDKFKLFLGDGKRDPQILDDETNITPDMENNIIDVPMEHKREFEDNLIRSIRDIAGRRVQADISLFKSKQQINNLFINPNRFTSDIVTMSFSDSQDVLSNYVKNLDYFKNPIHPHSYRFIHLDIATKKDRFGLASVYSATENIDIVTPSQENYNSPKIIKNERIFYVDFAVAIEAKKGEEINIFKVIDFIFLIKKLGYPIKMVTSDMFQGDVTRQFLKLHGTETNYLSVDRTKDPYNTLKELVNTSRIIGVKNDLLIKELLGLREYDKKFDHLLNSSKDIADALAGALFACVNSKVYTDNYHVYKSVVEKYDKDSIPDSYQIANMLKQAKKNKFKETIDRKFNF